MKRNRKTAATVLLIGAVAFSVSVQADTPAPETPSQRNPVIWLFSDLAGIFIPAADEESQTSPEPVLLKEPEPVEPAPLLAAPTPAVETAETVASSNNPISAILRGLADLFGGTGGNTMADASVEPVIEPVAEPAPAPEPAKAEAAAPETVTDSAEVATQPKHANAVSWMVSDFFGLFGGGGSAPDADTASAEPVPSSPSAKTPQPADEFVGLSFEADTQPEPMTENAAWYVNTGGDIFDPNAPAISLDPSAPLITRAPPVETTELDAPAAVELPDAEVESQALRVKQTRKLSDLNVGSLGRKHKAVTPDPEDGGLFSNLFGIFSGGDDGPASPAQPSETASKPEESADATKSEILTNTVSSRIVPEEKLDLGYTAPDADITRRTVEPISETALSDIDLFMGDKIVVGDTMPGDALASGNCVERPVHRSVFCLQPLNWPAAAADLFDEDTAFTLPGEGVVRYENGRLSRAYAVFGASNFADVVKFMQRRFGPPAEREIVWMHMLEAPELPNTTFRWKAVSADRRDVIILEVRNYDDLRRSFADLNHGMVRLYRDGSRPIFKHLSTMDLMLLQRRRIANAPAEPAN